MFRQRHRQSFGWGAVWVEKRVSSTPPSELGGDPGFSAPMLTMIL